MYHRAWTRMAKVSWNNLTWLGRSQITIKTEDVHSDSLFIKNMLYSVLNFFFPCPQLLTRVLPLSKLRIPIEPITWTTSTNSNWVFFVFVFIQCLSYKDSTKANWPMWNKIAHIYTGRSELYSASMTKDLNWLDKITLQMFITWNNWYHIQARSQDFLWGGAIQRGDGPNEAGGGGGGGGGWVGQDYIYSIKKSLLLSIC